MSAAMTPRERLFAVLSGQPVDRTPCWLLFPYHPLGCYVDVRTNPCYREVFEASKDRAVMLDRRHVSLPRWRADVECGRERTEEDGWTVDRETLAWRDVRLTRETRRRGGDVVVKKWLDDEDDLAAFARLPMEEDPAVLAAALDREAPRLRAEREAFPARYGATMLDLGEPVNLLYQWSNLEEYAVWSLICPEVVEGALERAMRRTRTIYRLCLERDLADVYFLVGSELASPPLLSEATFTRWIVPYAAELIGMIHAYGKKAIQHYHGQIGRILPHFLTMGADALHTIEAPPVGDCTLTRAFDVVGDRLALIGNIQYDEFRRLAPDEMEAAVRAALDEGRGKRFILSPTAGPYEETVPRRATDNYLRFLDAAWKYG